MDETLLCDRLNKSSYDTVYHAVQGCSNFEVCGWNPRVCTIQMKAIETHFHVALFVMLYKVVATQVSVWQFLFKLMIWAALLSDPVRWKRSL